MAVLARGREALDETVDTLLRLGSPDALGLEVDVSDTFMVDAAFTAIDLRWNALNVLVNTVGPGAGRFEALDS